MTSQREATVNAILSVLADKGVHYELGGETHVSEVLTTEDKKKVREILVAGFNAGTIQMSEEGKQKYVGKNELNSYVSGLVNNWVRKFPGFNNDTRYQAKNPGSRAGSTDEQVKEMKKLLAATSDATAKSIIQEAISARLAEIKPEKQVTINLDALPEELKAKLGL